MTFELFRDLRVQYLCAPIHGYLLYITLWARFSGYKKKSLWVQVQSTYYGTNYTGIANQTRGKK